MTDVLDSMEWIAAELLRNDLPAFSIRAIARKTSVRSSHLSSAFIKVLKTDATVIQERFPLYIRHPYVSAFMRLAQEYNLYQWAVFYESLNRAELLEVALRVNDLCVSLREEYKSKAFRASMKGHRALVRKNNRSLHRYIDALFETYARLLVIRVDLDYCTGAHISHDWTQAREHRKLLIVFLNKELPRMLQSKLAEATGERSSKPPGYVICAEYGAEAGWHFHVTLFLDGNQSRRSIEIARFVGEYWRQKITMGFGRYWNCNAHPSKYKRWGIGDVHWSDVEKRANLKAAIAYFGKTDYYGKGLIEGKDRFLSRGGMPKKKKKSGRPRSAPSQARDAAKPHFLKQPLLAIPLRSPTSEAEIPF